MNKTQKKIMFYVRRYNGRKGTTPTQREIALYVGRSVSTVNQSLHLLEEMGEIVMDKKRSANSNRGRTIILPKAGNSSRRIDL